MASLVYLDCFSGVSGDKLLAGLLDAGAPLGAVNEALAALDAGISVGVVRVMRQGIAGSHLQVNGPDESPARDWGSVSGLLAEAKLPEDVRARSLEAFRLLAEAEGRIHGQQPERVHFHEVGAIDTLADIVGVSAALSALGVTDVVCSPVAVGHGMVRTDHGQLPIPAPATAEILRGVPVLDGGVAAELTTPTGACLVRSLASSFGPMPAATVGAVGYGAGKMDLPVANVLRVILMDSGAAVEAEGPVRSEEVAVLRTLLDHLSPEETAFAAERLLEEGALDAWQTPVVMKKGRAAVELSAMCLPEDAPDLAALLISLTGTLGVRVERTSRLVLEREVSTCETSLGPVRMKVATGPNGERLMRPEHDDCAEISRRTGMSLREVKRKLQDEAGA